MVGVTFGSKHSYNDWGIWLEDTHINPPLPKRYIVDVPARNGLLDLTPELTPTIRFENRTLTFTFRVKAGDWSTLVSQIYGQIHGQTLDVISDLHPQWHWHGCVTVDDFSSDERTGVLVITVDADPFKLSNTENSYTVNGNGTITCVVDRMEISPAFELTAPTTVIYGDSSYVIESTATTEKTLSGDIVSFVDGTANPAVDLTADIDAVQDLHGYDHPWVGGAGLNLVGGVQLKENILNSLSSNTSYDDTNRTVTFASNSTAVADKNFTEYTFKENTQYTLILTGYNSSSGRSNMRVYYKDGTNDNVGNILGTSSKATAVFVTASGKSLDYVTKVTSAGTTVLYYDECGIFEGVLTASDFSPYENICPISGWTGANIHRTGLNILPSYSYWTQQNCTMTLDNSSSTFTLTNTGSSGFRQVLLQGDNRLILPKGTGRKLRVYCKFESSNTNLNPRMMIYDQDSNSVLTKTTSDTWETVTLADSVQKLQVILRLTQSNTNLQSGDVVTFKNVQLQYGDSSTEFSEINFTIIPITWTDTGTVYGGTLDVTTGVLTVTWKSKDMGDMTWVYNSTNQYFSSTSASDKKYGNNNVQASCYKTVNVTAIAQMNNGEIKANAGAVTIYLKDFNYTDGDALKTARTGQTIIYELNTPQTVQLTAEQVTTLKNQNNIWADSGEVEVTYLAQDFAGRKFFIPDLELTEGSHSLTIQGTGTTKVTYTNGRL